MRGSLWMKIGLSFPRVSSNLTLKKSLTFYKRISSVSNQEGAVSKKRMGVEVSPSVFCSWLQIPVGLKDTFPQSRSWVILLCL